MIQGKRYERFEPANCGTAFLVSLSLRIETDITQKGVVGTFHNSMHLVPPALDSPSLCRVTLTKDLDIDSFNLLLEAQ